MNLNQIQYLLAIHETGSIRQAADNLFVSAPSISTAIKNLEDELGCSLLTRHHNGVTFTDEGEEAILLMKEMEEIINKLHHLRQNVDTDISGEIKLGVSLHAKPALLLPVLSTLKFSYPGLSLTVSDEKSHDILKQIIQGTLDLGLIHYSNLDRDDFIEDIQRNHLKFSPLFTGEMRFVVRDGHPLTALSNITMKDILQYPFLNYYKADFTKAHHKLFHQYNPNYEILQPEDRDMYRNLLHNSNAVSTMPELNERRSIKQFTGLTFIPVPDIDYHCTIGWLHNSEPLTRIEEVVIQTLQQKAESFQKECLE